MKIFEKNKINNIGIGPIAIDLCTDLINLSVVHFLFRCKRLKHVEPLFFLSLSPPFLFNVDKSRNFYIMGTLTLICLRDDIQKRKVKALHTL